MSFLPRLPESALALVLCGLVSAGLAQEGLAQQSLTFQKKYDVGVVRYSEGLDFYDGFLWHTTTDTLHQFDPADAVDVDGDGDYDLRPVRSWHLDHLRDSESCVWFEGELFNFAYRDTYGNLCDSFYKLHLNDDETYWWQEVTQGLGITNWGTCRDRLNPGRTVIYTGHYTNLLMWLEPATGQTTRTIAVPEMDWIEDLGMDRYGTLWASSFDYHDYPGFFRLDPATGETLERLPAPDGLPIIDGIAVRSFVDHDVMYVTGKDSRYIWEYEISTLVSGATDDLPAAGVELRANYPNPFNPMTSIVFSLPRDLPVRLDVYGLDGRLVRSLVNETRTAGAHTVTWNGTDDNGRAVASGTYLYRLAAGQDVQSRRMLLVR